MLKKSSFYYIFLIFLFIFHMNNYPTIITVRSHQEIKKHIRPTSTVIYDIDETLAYRENIFFHPRARHHKKLIKEQLDAVSPELYQKLLSKLHRNSPMFLMEKHLPTLITEFIAQGARVFACTKRTHGTFGVIDNFEEHTHELVQKLGITFNFWDHSFFYKNPLRIELNPQKCTAGRSCQALLFNNIYFTDENQKGPALQALFSTLGYIPKHIVFVDDIYDNLVSVDTTFTELGIPITCVYYTKPQPDMSFSKKDISNLVKDTLVDELDHLKFRF